MWKTHGLAHGFPSPQENDLQWWVFHFYVNVYGRVPLAKTDWLIPSGTSYNCWKKYAAEFRRTPYIAPQPQSTRNGSTCSISTKQGVITFLKSSDFFLCFLFKSGALFLALCYILELKSLVRCMLELKSSFIDSFGFTLRLASGFWLLASDFN